MIFDFITKTYHAKRFECKSNSRGQQKIIIADKIIAEDALCHYKHKKIFQYIAALHQAVCFIFHKPEKPTNHVEAHSESS